MRNLVYETVKEISGCSDVTDDMSLEFDLGLDSLNRILLLLNLEEKANITLETSDINPNELLTIGDLIRLLEKYEV